MPTIQNSQWFAVEENQPLSAPPPELREQAVVTAKQVTAFAIPLILIVASFAMFSFSNACLASAVIITATAALYNSSILQTLFPQENPSPNGRASIVLVNHAEESTVLLELPEAKEAKKE